MPDSPPAASKPRSLLRTMLLLIALAIFGAGTILALGPLGIVLTGGSIAFVALLSLHYLVWGKWLSRELQADAAQEDEPAGGPPPAP